MIGAGGRGLNAHGKVVVQQSQGLQWRGGPGDHRDDAVGEPGDGRRSQERFDAIASNLTRLEAEGIASVVVFMPMSSNRVSMFEGGREEIAGILAEIEGDKNEP